MQFTKIVSLAINPIEELHTATFPPITSQMARFMGPTWGPPGDNRTQVGPMLAPMNLAIRDRTYPIKIHRILLGPLIARFMGPTWGPSGADRTQMGPMLAPWTLLSGTFFVVVRPFLMSGFKWSVSPDFSGLSSQYYNAIVEPME